MTVAELIAWLSRYPKDKLVYVPFSPYTSPIIEPQVIEGEDLILVCSNISHDLFENVPDSAAQELHKYQKLCTWRPGSELMHMHVQAHAGQWQIKNSSNEIMIVHEVECFPLQGVICALPMGQSAKSFFQDHLWRPCIDGVPVPWPVL